MEEKGIREYTEEGVEKVIILVRWWKERERKRAEKGVGCVGFLVVSTKKSNALLVKCGSKYELMVYCLIEVVKGEKDGVCSREWIGATCWFVERMSGLFGKDR